jgi:hypothetical protein
MSHTHPQIVSTCPSPSIPAAFLVVRERVSVRVPIHLNKPALDVNVTADQGHDSLESPSFSTASERLAVVLFPFTKVVEFVRHSVLPFEAPKS